MPVTFARNLLASPPAWILLGLSGCAVHFLLAAPLYTPLARFSACALLVAAMLATRRFITQPEASGPLIPLVTLQIYVVYGLAQFRAEPLALVHGPYLPSERSVETAAILLAVCTVLMLLSAYWAARKFRNSQFGSFFPDPSARWRSAVIAYFLLTVAISFYTALVGSAAGVRNVLVAVFSAPLALCLLVYFATTLRDRLLLTMSYAGAILFSVIGLLSGFLETTVVPLYVLMMSFWVFQRRLKLAWVVAAVLVFALLQPVKLRYRVESPYLAPFTTFAGVEQRLSLWATAFIEVWTFESDAIDVVSFVSARTNFLLQFAQVVEWVPGSVPQRGGGALLQVIPYQIPRILWPAKPSISDIVNNPYALTFHQTTEEGLQRVTIGMLQPADGYWDFGVAGSLLYLCATGVLYGAVTGGIRPSGRGSRPSRAIVSLCLSAAVFQALVSLATLLASIVSQLIGIWIALRMIELWSAAFPARSRGKVNRKA
jgi:hypothetical protein